MSRVPLHLLIAAAPLIVLTGCKPPEKQATASHVDFNRDIQPVLAERCYHCHGPDSGSRKSGLRLDLAETAFAKRPGKSDAIIKGKPDSSELIRRISAHDDGVMPPREGVEKPLTGDQVELFRRWIAEGAVYRPHWAFEKPERPAVPVVAGDVKNPVDAFVLAKLKEKGLAPNPEADRATLVRRVTLDLTGLLPTPEETAAFLSDTAPDAYEKVVDRLLASTAYGEQRARYWLDGARYGDTHGLHIDNYRSIWPYRDYVIRAYNTNKPFDAFVREQLAGDMSAPTKVDAIVATGFVRAGISSGEGGTIIEELRTNNKRERTEAYGAVFLGLTVGCANCHDHKFDPTSQKDFFALSAYFNNLTENPSNGDGANWMPVLRVPKPDKLAAYDETLSRKAEVLRKIDARERDAFAEVKAWLATNPKFEATSEAGLKLRLRFDENAGAELKNSAPDATPKTLVATGGAPQWGEDTWFWPSFRMETGTRIELPALGDIEKTDSFSAGAWVMPRLETAASNSQNLGSIVSRMDSADAFRGWDVYYDIGKISVHLIAHWPDDAIKVTTKQSLLQRGRWEHVFATYDGSGKAAGIRIYVNGKAVETVVDKDALKGSIRTKVPFEVGRRSPDSMPLRQSRYQDLRYYARALPPEEAARVAYEDRVVEVLRKPLETLSGDEFKVVSDYYFTNADTAMLGLRAQIPPIDAELMKLAKDGEPTIVCEDSDRLAYADVLSRGSYTDRIGRVAPAVPHFLPQPAKGAPADRRTLADWTVSPENPLTARVTVNRMWNELFGTGIVETTDDFGIMGARPSDPALLDWLAVEFRDKGWDMKHMYRTMVLSAAYRRSAKATPEMLEKDPANRFLARGPRYRMDAEMLRDSALQASGLLSPKIGGPSVKPYMPAGVWEGVGYPSSNTVHYKQDTGESLYRRSLYTFRKRQAIAPAMETLDSPVLDATCTRRQHTNTPLQALVTMNDPQWVEAARFLAERAMKEGGETDAARLDFIGLTLLAKKPAPAVRDALSEALEKFRKRYAADAASAVALLSTGEKPRDPKLAPSELAAWTLVCSALMNSDMALNK